MAGETRDSVIQMYNQMIFDNNNVSEFVDQSQHSQRSVSPQLTKHYYTNRAPSVEKTRRELSFNSARDKQLPSDVINAQQFQHILTDNLTPGRLEHHVSILDPRLQTKQNTPNGQLTASMLNSN